MTKIFLIFSLWIVLGFCEDLIVQDLGKWINDKIKNGETYIIIPKGVYYLLTPIKITKSNVIIEGKGDVLIISKLHGNKKSIIKILGRKGEFVGYTSTFSKRGSKEIYGYFQNVKENIKYIWIYKENDIKFVREKLKSEKWFKQRPYLRQGIYKVKKIEANRIILEDNLDIDYPKYSQVYALELVENISIINLRFTQHVDKFSKFEHIKFIYKNLYPEYQIDTLHIKYGANIKLLNIIIELSGRHPLNIENSYKVFMKNIKVYGSLNKGKGGNGYVRFSKTYKSVLKNCYIEGIRHIVFQWASSQNTIENCFLKVDVNFHGGYERYNRVIKSKIEIPKEHPWAPVEKTPNYASWAPPSGPGNVVIETFIEIK
ncbi:hypothetical protein [Aquifex sp.]